MLVELSRGDLARLLKAMDKKIHQLRHIGTSATMAALPDYVELRDRLTKEWNK